MQKQLLRKNILKSSSESAKSPEGPSEQTVQNILNYSKALRVRKSKLIKHIEEVLN